MKKQFTFFLALVLLVLSSWAQTTRYVPADFATIQAAINASTAGDVINVAAGNYDENLTVSKALTFIGANANIAGNGSRGPESKVLDTRGTDLPLFNIKSDGVTVNGFELTAPGSNQAIYMGDGSGNYNYSNLNIEFNYIHDIGTLPPTGHVYAIDYYVPNIAATTSNINISDNYINTVHSGSNNKSAGGIYFANSTSTGIVNNVTIMRNKISNIISTYGSANSWGILIGTSGTGYLASPVISYNEISGLVSSSLGNAHAIGLEGNTPGALVTNNKISLTTNQYGV